ncbi:hypothetical protein [Luteirhabdus pelagi]|uniref:hypothetical protein n=1 Tax=Luteirhabdus pelagi TaxID=2792783 RepID=UPI00193A5F68|nr:hypothetical protein [Luteirhabdus pelagi]
MKKIKVLAMAAMLLAGSLTIAANNNLNDDLDPSSAIASLLENPTFDYDANMEALVSFIINDEGELVVLSVQTQHENFEYFLKSRLNYKKISDVSLQPGKQYKIPVKLML